MGRAINHSSYSSILTVKLFLLVAPPSRPHKHFLSADALMSSPLLVLDFWPGKLFCPHQSLADVTAAPCSLGNQLRAPGAASEVTAHRHCPIRSREIRRALIGAKEDNERKLPRCDVISWYGTLPEEPGRHTEPSQNASGERAASRDCEEQRRSGNSPFSSKSGRNHR